ncbi:MAG: hypothetical protein FJW88_04000 [Actinobacteria bacterium]|nr:hypothetical protein [Actinomycetota bacterium]
MTMFADPDAGRSLTRYFGLTLRETSAPGAALPTVEGDLAVLDHVRAPAGNVRAGALLTVADSVAGLCGGLAALPGWVVSTNLMLHVASFEAVGPLRAAAQVLRTGRNAVVTGVSILDDGRSAALVADGVLTSAVLQPKGGAPDYPRPLHLEAGSVDPWTTEPLPEYLAVRPMGPAAVAIDLDDRLRNPWGILHGGAIAALVDMAAEHATGGTTADTVLHFLSPGRVGPVMATVETVGTRADGTLARVEVRDRGAADRLMTMAAVTCRP